MSQATNIFTESDLAFSFPAEWVVRKFDDTVAYQSLSGHGLKGVDFIALSPDGKLWLMEVKNYRPRNDESGREHRAIRRRPQELAEHVAQKFHDTRRLIRIVNSSLRRVWWRRAWLWYLENIRPNGKSNYWFWSEAFRRANTTESIVFVLWMETPEEPDNYDESTRKALTSLLEPTAQLYVAEAERDMGLPIEVV
jgi:hypothetical protein